jgi:hypothetical protein
VAQRGEGAELLEKIPRSQRDGLSVWETHQGASSEGQNIPLGTTVSFGDGCVFLPNRRKCDGTGQQVHRAPCLFEVHVSGLQHGNIQIRRGCAREGHRSGDSR